MSHAQSPQEKKNSSIKHVLMMMLFYSLKVFPQHSSLSAISISKW